MTTTQGKHAVFEAVKRNVLEILPDLDPEDVLIEVSLSDLGANSVDRADVVTMTMEDLGITVPVSEFQNVRDIRSLVELLSRHV